MSGPDILQVKDSSMCGIVAATQICNWLLPLHWSFLDRSWATQKAVKKFQLLDDDLWLGPNEANWLVKDLAREKVKSEGLDDIKLFSPLEQELTRDKKSQLLCSLGEKHFIVIHGEISLNMFVVSGLSDAYGNYVPPMILSRAQLFGEASFEVNGVSMRLPKYSVKPLYKY